MHFEVVHEFEAPLDAIELAILSPHLIDKLGPFLPNVDKVTQVEHRFEGDKLRRVWAYEPDLKVPAFAAAYVKPEMCAWRETSIYSLKKHASEWEITPERKPEWKKYFYAHGTYALVPSENGTTRRVVHGDVDLHVPPIMRGVAERIIVKEVKKSFEAEASLLRDLATLV